MRSTIRARAVLPIGQPPIDNGAVILCGDRIEAVGSWNDIRKGGTSEVCDLGECALLPGLINAHCHLDFTSLAGRLHPSGRFHDWIKAILEARDAWQGEDYRRSWLEGAGMLLRGGVTTVADTESQFDLLPDILDGTPLRVTSLLEMTGVRSRLDPEAVLDETLRLAGTLAGQGNSIGLSPHSPYATLPALLRGAAAAARRQNLPLSIHIAESRDEFEVFAKGSGPMFDWLARNHRDMSDCGGTTPLQQVAALGALGKNVLAIHCNYLTARDISLLAKTGTHVVHCPRSHAWFGHDNFRFHDLGKAGVNLCLGTDSLATVDKTGNSGLELSLLAELQTFAETHPEVSPETILETVTTNAAAALGRSGRIGELTPGSLADCIAIPCPSVARKAAEAVVHYAGHVEAAMIGGHWVLPPSRHHHHITTRQGSKHR